MANNKQTYHFKRGNIEIMVKVLKDNLRLYANANVSIKTEELGWIETKHWKLWKSDIFNDRIQAKMNIEPPKLQFKGRGFHNTIFIPDRDKWCELEMLIYSAYNEAISKQAGKEDIDPDSIDI